MEPADPFPELAPHLQQRAQALQAGTAPYDWREWLALRQLMGSCVDRRWAYGHAQLMYHYTKDRQILVAEVEGGEDRGGGEEEQSSAQQAAQHSAASSSAAAGPAEQHSTLQQ